MNIGICRRIFSEEEPSTAKCNLVLSELPDCYEYSERLELCAAAHDWAESCAAREVICWSALVRSRLELENYDLPVAERTISEGLKMACDCGYGLLIIDFLLERARLHLFRGDGKLALDDISLALDRGDGPDSKETPVRFLSANNEDCNYVWAIARGLKIRGQAELHVAATEIGQDSFVPAKFRLLPPDVIARIEDGKESLEAAMERWKYLRDPEPKSPDQNYSIEGIEYNFQATDTHSALADLQGGILTTFPITPKAAGASEIDLTGNNFESSLLIRTREPVFISYAHPDNEDPDPKRCWLDRFLKFLKPFVRQDDMFIWSDKDIQVGEDWHSRIQEQLLVAKAAVLLISPSYLASDYIASNELPVLLKKATDRGLKMIPILVSPCSFAKTRFRYPDPQAGPKEFFLSSLQAVNSPSKTLIEMDEGEQNRVLIDAAEQLAEFITN